MRTGSQNKGFTLVEIIIALSISAFITINIVLLSGNSFRLHRNTKVTSQIEIETQVIMNNLKKTIQESSSLVYETKDSKYSYVFTVAGKEVEYLCVGDKIYYTESIPEDKFSIDTDENYLGQYVKELSINNNSSYSLENKNIQTVEVNLTAEQSGIEGSLSETVRLRNSR